jgi:hypothetical protein
MSGKFFSTSVILFETSSKDKIEFHNITKVRIIAIFTSIAFFEFNTQESIATPYSLKTKGANLVPP